MSIKSCYSLVNSKEHIFEKGSKPGDRLPTDAELAKIFGLIRSSVREAIKAGDVEGLQKIIDVHLSRYYEEVRQTVNERKNL